jgi:hypothetical protein
MACGPRKEGARDGELELRTRIRLGSGAGREVTKRDPPVDDSEQGRLAWAGVGPNCLERSVGLPRPCRPFFGSGPCWHYGPVRRHRHDPLTEPG